jgi:hypothetical protein
MKLRLRGSSLRLRLSQTEVETLTQTGLLEETVDFKPNPLVYILHSSKDCKDIQASFLNGWISVTVPEDQVKSWVSSPSVGMEGVHRGVSILIEKDFACAHGDAAQNEDAFPHPGAL